MENSPSLTDEQLGQYATNTGLERTSFDACLAGSGKDARIQQDVNSGTALNVASTPTFFVDGEMVIGFRTASQLGAIIDRHLGG